MIDKNDLPAYISEISKITQTSVNETRRYIRYRAIGEGFGKNVFWLKDTNPSAISFFNGINGARELAVVMSVWKMMEPPQEGKEIPGEIAQRINPIRRRKHDEIRSLPRLAWLFRIAFADGYENYACRYAERQNEIILENRLPQRDMSDFTDKMNADRDLILSICTRIDELSSSDTCRNLDIARNEGFAHSSEISRKSIKCNLSDDDYNFTRPMLFSFGDQVMQLALDFEAIWKQRSRPSIADSIKAAVSSGSSFWDELRTGISPDKQGLRKVTSKVMRIERVKPRAGKQETPWLTPFGYCLGDPQHGGEKHHSGNAVYVRTLHEAAELIARGFSLRMTGPGKRPSLISPAGLRIVKET